MEQKTSSETAMSDSFKDGTPDFLRLHDARDRNAFRTWFTFLAEYQATRQTSELPSEIQDCAALLRYSYRESLKKHTADWMKEQRLDYLPSGGSIEQYQYPHTLLGPALFRIKDGLFVPDDLRNGTFAQFADAHTLVEKNTHLIGRSLDLARPGDLLFYRQLEQMSAYHSMIFLGVGHFSDTLDDSSRKPAKWVVYHTGPMNGGKGEIRRLSLAELLHHPDARWHPITSNPNFLGVYRWNILREDQ